MTALPRTAGASLARARDMAGQHGLRYVYTGNVHDPEGGTTRCHGCGAALVVRDWYELEGWALDDAGHCLACGTRCAGVFAGPPGEWGRKRLPVRLGDTQSLALPEGT